MYGSISGTVTDSSGAVLPGVSVTVTSTERKTTDTVVTNESGFFLKERLVPGTYEVKAELASFKTAVVPSVIVNVDAQTPINFKLEVGELTETVTVTGGSPLLKTDRADVATSFQPEAADGASRPRSELHQVHPADARHPAARDGSTPPARTRRAPSRRW